MRDDVVMKLLREVKAGKVSVEDARDALSEVELSEDAYQKAVDHGVFNDPEPGLLFVPVFHHLVILGLSSYLLCGGFYGPYIGLVRFLMSRLYNHWDQQRLSFHLAMTLLHSNFDGNSLPEIRNA